jgi:hypothetical protein
MSYQSTVLGRSPVFYLPQTETAGGTFADLSGNGHTGTLYTWGGTPLDVGGADAFLTGERALVFPTFWGDSQEVQIGAAPSFPTLTTWSLEFWVQLQGEYSGTHDDWLNMAITDVSAGKIAVDLEEGASATDVHLFLQVMDITHDIPLNLTHPACWHHYVLTLDAASLSVYVDGALVQAISSEAFSAFSLTPGGSVWNNNTRQNKPFSMAHCALYASALSADDVAANFAAATPRQDAACFLDTIQLKHAGDIIDWQHNSLRFAVKSAGVDVLVTPFATLSATPQVLMGQDPETSLPAYCPQPTIVQQQIPIPPTVPPDDGVDVHEQICGAAFAMATWIEDVYDKIGGVFDAGEAGLFVWAVGTILGELSAALKAAEVAADWLDNSVLQTIAKALAASYLANDFPQLQSEQFNSLWNGAYCALLPSVGSIAVTANVIASWHNWIATHSSDYATGGQGWLLQQIMNVVAPAKWQQVAMTSTPNSGCGTMGCS